jgi:orotidine-5'-phosphate decarboxylase
MVYREWIEETARRNQSNIILALDIIAERKLLLQSCLELLEKISPLICAIKINRHIVLPLGLYDGVQRIIDLAHNLGLPVIMDCKINDIGYTNQVIAENYFKAGFDAVTANPFVGWEGGLGPVFDLAKQEGKGVLLLVYMSHKGAFEGYGQSVLYAGETRKQYEVFAEKALEWEADGAIVGATYPEKIARVFQILGEKVPIYSPGIGPQGGEIEPAVKAGARYLIIGRAIWKAKNPVEAAKDFLAISRKYL